MFKHRISFKLARKVVYWLLLCLGVYLIPRSYQEWKSTESKLEQISKGIDLEGFDTETRLKATEERVEQWLADSQKTQMSKTFCPPASNRKFWDSLDKPNQQDPATAFTIGKPSPIVVIYEGTRQECFYNSGKWLPEIEEALRELLTESWGKKDKHGKDFVDLLATTKAREISHCLSMLEDKLPPGLVLETKREIRKRILDPYRKELNRAQLSIGYFGGNPCPWLGGRESNWIAVCVANILYCSMVVDDTQEQASLIAKSKEPIEDYLKTFESDGSIAAGIRYWDYGFQHLLLLAELLDYKTNGNINLFNNPKLAKMVTYPFHTLIGKNDNQDLEFYPLFADNKNPTKTSDWMWEIIKQRFDVPENHSLLSNRVTYPQDCEGAVMDLLIHKSKLEKTPPKIKTNISKQNSFYYPNNGILISRFNDNKEAVTISGGNNGTEHNHNDIGSYTFFSKNPNNYWLPVFGDMGDVKYIESNFTSQGRYKVPLLNSYGHPVPIVDNQLQFTSPKAQSKVLNHQITEDKDTVTYDLLPAYNVPEVITLTREAIVFKKGEDGLKITDTFIAKRPINFESSIIASTIPKQPLYNKNNNTMVMDMETDGEKFLITIDNADTLSINIEQLSAPGFDYNPKTSIKTPPYRISLKLKQKSKEGEITYKLNKVRVKNKPIESKAIPPRMTE